MPDIKKCNYIHYRAFFLRKKIRLQFTQENSIKNDYNLKEKLGYL